MNERTPSGAIRFCAHIVVDIQTALSYPGDMEFWLKGSCSAPLTGVEWRFALASPFPSPDPSPAASPFPSRQVRTQSPQMPIATRFADLRLCRHLYATSRSKYHMHPSRPDRAGDLLPRAPRSRRLRYRLRAGSTALPRTLGCSDRTRCEHDRLRDGDTTAPRLRAG